MTKAETTHIRSHQDLRLTKLQRHHTNGARHEITLLKDTTQESWNKRDCVLNIEKCVTHLINI